MKGKRRQATDPQKLKKNCHRSFFCFLLVEAQAAAIVVKAKAVEK